MKQKYYFIFGIIAVGIILISGCVQEKPKEICEIGKEYEHTAVSPIKCECPEGYEFEVVEMGWGPCPRFSGKSDCPASTLKCVK